MGCKRWNWPKPPEGMEDRLRRRQGSLGVQCGVTEKALHGLRAFVKNQVVIA